MRAIDADALQLAIVEEGQANKRKKYIIGDIWELTGAEIREVINSQPTIQSEIIRCKDCKCWVPGYITDNDDFIPPKCGEWQQMVGHSSDDYCSLAERREVTE